jgi:hypothetical protein
MVEFAENAALAVKAVLNLNSSESVHAHGVENYSALLSKAPYVSLSYPQLIMSLERPWLFSLDSEVVTWYFHVLVVADF